MSIKKVEKAKPVVNNGNVPNIIESIINDDLKVPKAFAVRRIISSNMNVVE